MTSTSTINAEGRPDYDEKSYWTNRDYKTSSRLFMQHWMWQLQLGYVLHPSIPESIRTKPDLKIADVACGNGAWLFELQAPETSQLDGYDLSANCFGAKEWLAKNVTLTGDFDALKPLHESLKGQYDIVHIRAVVSIIKNNNVKPLVETLMGLLKPGGYLQWEDVDFGKLTARVPDGSSLQNPASQALVQFMSAAGASTGLSTEWIENIRSTISEEGFEVIDHAEIEWRSVFQKGWNDNLLTVYEELAGNLPLAKDAPANFPMTREVYQGLFQQTAKECVKGVWLYQPAWSVLAKKP